MAGVTCVPCHPLRRNEYNHVLETGPLVLKYYHKSIICSVNSLGNPFIFDSENMQCSQVWSWGLAGFLAEGRSLYCVKYGCLMLIELSAWSSMACAYGNCRTLAEILGTSYILCN